ncbi:putative inactive group IIC secretory phospholipase A2 isoform X2 [Psammomys obesus]|uniref:putative inactive group IIC secretory phospholipase A2 isoform X2 n=1 Tax=Psammomys obesus TaxID=48139 RepID=UPI0024531E2A|nr:putative inactive group IIC secretory phospholipase A2 isoform X2 [Psammomys obesus]
MKGIAVFIVFIFCWTTSTLSSFWQFQRMVKHVTGRSAFFSYYGYGCYCGLGGRGIPVDATDRCCWAHDCCYHKLKENGCQPILHSYQFSIVNGTVACLGSWGTETTLGDTEGTYNLSSSRLVMSRGLR